MPKLDGTTDALYSVSAGERTVPGVWHENYWFRRHEVVYAWASARVQRARVARGRDVIVVDAGCGEGYGTQALADHTPTVALDYDVWTVEHLTRARPELAAVRGNLASLPLGAGTIDILVSLQTIEHLWDQSGFVAECARVLRPGGRLILSTPNRLTFPPGNVFHHRELDGNELSTLMTEHLDDVDLYGVHHGERLRRWEQDHGDLVREQIRRPYGEWARPLRALVSSVGVDDFEIGPATPDCLDLVAVAVAP